MVLLADIVNWSRAQFALTACYHWLFVPLTLGLGLIVALMETMYYRTKDEKWLATTKFWMTLFGVNFAIGVATGIILEFEFGTNWSNYSWFVGDIFGAPLAIEGILAFFMESTFIAVMFFGWKKVSPKFHLVSTWLTWVGASVSAFWILIANAWMQDPTGVTFNPDTMRNEMTDFFAVALSPTAVNKIAHTLTSSWSLGAAFVIGISGWMLLRKRNTEHCWRSIKVGSAVGVVGILLAGWSGDTSAVNIAEKQPMKLAAMEGLYKGSHGQSLVGFGILNSEKKIGDNQDPFVFEIPIPNGLSLLARHDMNAFVPGIEDVIAGRDFVDGKQVDTRSYAQRIESGKAVHQALADYDAAKKRGDQATMDAKRGQIQENFRDLGYGYFQSPEEIVPNVPLTFYSFRVMVMIGGFLLLFLFISFIFSKKRSLIEGRAWEKPWWWIAIAAVPLSYLCSMAGWIVAEVGRQPWTIQDLMPNKAAVSDLSASYVQITFWIFAVVFTVLLIADISIICTQIAKKSKTDLETAKL